jgi:hypothetical protein
MLFFRCLIGAAALSAAPARAQAQAHPERVIQEFFLGEMSYVQEAGETQLTLTPVYWKERDRDRTDLSLSGEYGFNGRLQAEFEAPYSYLRADPDQSPVGGFGDASLGLMYGLVQGNDPLALSVRAGVILPTGSVEKTLGSGVPGWDAGVILGRIVGEAQIHAHLGAQFDGGQSELASDLAVVRPWRALRPTLELNDRASTDEGNRLFLTPGCYYHLSPRTEAGLGLPLGLTRASARYGVVAKLTLEFGGKD